MNEEIKKIEFNTEILYLLGYRIFLKSDGKTYLVDKDGNDIDAFFIPWRARVNGQLYEISSISAHLFKYVYNLKKIEIPDTVTKIGKGAFYGCENLKSINIPEGIEIIEKETFADCKRLETIKFPDTLKTIEARAFYGCSNLTVLDFPKNLRKIKDSAFEECISLKNVNLPENLHALYDLAFYKTGMYKLNLPAGIGIIGDRFVSNIDTTPVEVYATKEICKIFGEKKGETIFKEYTLDCLIGAKRSFKEINNIYIKVKTDELPTT